jgi:hypothetical protein
MAGLFRLIEWRLSISQLTCFVWERFDLKIQAVRSGLADICGSVFIFVWQIAIMRIAADPILPC